MGLRSGDEEAGARHTKAPSERPTEGCRGGAGQRGAGERDAAAEDEAVPSRVQQGDEEGGAELAVGGRRRQEPGKPWGDRVLTRRVLKPLDEHLRWGPKSAPAPISGPDWVARQHG